jgi:hypothetical protein
MANLNEVVNKVTRRRIVPAVCLSFPTVFVLTTLWSGAVLAVDDCITKPNLHSAPGGHWNYRADRVNHRRCWYVERAAMAVPRTAARKAQSSQMPIVHRPLVKRSAQRSARLDQAGRDALFGDFLQWQEQRNEHGPAVDEAKREALFREFVRWQEGWRHPERQDQKHPEEGNHQETDGPPAMDRWRLRGSFYENPSH